MKIAAITMDRDEALARAELYLCMTNPNPEDEAILAGLLAIIEGQPVIDIAQAVAAGGRHPDGTPRLAIGRADWQWCWLQAISGRVTFQPARSPHWRSQTFSYPIPDAPRESYWRTGVRSHVPPIPPPHRPSRTQLRHRLVLWEVDEWELGPQPPGDPALLRPITRNLAAVEHTWDLTELERAVLRGRE